MKRFMRKPVDLVGRLWRDDHGAVLATEWLLVTTVLVLGLIPGLIAIRQGILAEMGDIATATGDLDQSYGFTGQELGSGNDRGDGDRGAADDGKPYDPVAEAAARVTTLGGRAASDRGGRRSTDRRTDRGGRQADDERCIQAFTAGSTYLEEQHLSGGGRGSRIRSNSARGASSDARPCD